MVRLIKVVQDVIDVTPADWSPDEINGFMIFVKEKVAQTLINIDY